MTWLWELRDHAELNKAFHARIMEEGIYPVLEDHKSIYEAIAARDADKARDLMKAHLESATAAAAAYFSS